MNISLNKIGFFYHVWKIVSRKFSQKSQKTKIIKAKLKKMITLEVDFHSSTMYLQSQKFLALVTTLKYFFQSVRKILSGPCNPIPLFDWIENTLFSKLEDLKTVVLTKFHYNLPLLLCYSNIQTCKFRPFILLFASFSH